MAWNFVYDSTAPQQPRTEEETSLLNETYSKILQEERSDNSTLLDAWKVISGLKEGMPIYNAPIRTPEGVPYQTYAFIDPFQISDQDNENWGAFTMVKPLNAVCQRVNGLSLTLRQRKNQDRIMLRVANDGVRVDNLRMLLLGIPGQERKNAARAILENKEYCVTIKFEAGTIAKGAVRDCFIETPAEFNGHFWLGVLAMDGTAKKQKFKVKLLATLSRHYGGQQLQLTRG